MKQGVNRIVNAVATGEMTREEAVYLATTVAAVLSDGFTVAEAEEALEVLGVFS